MSTTLFNAREYDPRKDRRRRCIVWTVIAALIILGGVAYIFRFWPEERRVDQFFTAIEHNDYKKAYGLWQSDPAWEQHPAKYKSYPFGEFCRDWGPSGEWGIIHSHHVDGAATPKGGSTGVVVLVTINERVEPARLWVEKKDKTLTFSPF